MASGSGIIGPRVPQSLRRRLDLATASAWEALVAAHVRQAAHLITLIGEHWSYKRAIDRYLDAMAVTGPMAAAVRNRVLVGIEESAGTAAESPELSAAADRSSGFRPMAKIRSAARGIRDRVRGGDEEIDRLLGLVFGRAEEYIMATHVGYAVTFAELLDEHMSLDEAVKEYVDVVGLEGCRGQAVSQRAMYRIAEQRLPPLPDPAEYASATEAETR